MERDPYSDLTRDVLTLRGTAEGRKSLVEKISGIVYEYPRRHLRWDDDDSGDFFCMFYPKIEGLIERFAYSGKPFEAYLISSIRWQLKTFAKKRAIQRAEERAVKDESDFWQTCTLDEHEVPGETVHAAMVKDKSHIYSPEVSRTLKIEGEGKITDPAWAKRFLYLILRNVAFVDDSLMEHAAKLSGYDVQFILGCATELRERLLEKRKRFAALREKRNALHVRILQLNDLLSDETDEERIASYGKQLASARNRANRLNSTIRSAPVVPTHKDIAEVLGMSKGSVDSGLYYLNKAFEGLQRN